MYSARCRNRDALSYSTGRVSDRARGGPNGLSVMTSKSRFVMPGMCHGVANVIELESPPCQKALAFGALSRRGAGSIETLGERQTGEMLPVGRLRLESQCHQRFGDASLSHIDANSDGALPPRDTRAHEDFGEAGIGLKPFIDQIIQCAMDIATLEPLRTHPSHQLGARILAPGQKLDGDISRGNSSRVTVLARRISDGPTAIAEHQTDPERLTAAYRWRRRSQQRQLRAPFPWLSARRAAGPESGFRSRS